MPDLDPELAVSPDQDLPPSWHKHVVDGDLDSRQSIGANICEGQIDRSPGKPPWRKVDD